MDWNRNPGDSMLREVELWNDVEKFKDRLQATGKSSWSMPGTFVLNSGPPSNRVLCN